MDEATLYEQVGGAFDLDDARTALELLDAEHQLTANSDQLTYARLICLSELSKVEEARNLANEALRRWPESTYALAGKARICVDRGLYDEARRLAEKALELDPRASHALLALAECDFVFGGPEDSLAHVKELLNLADRPRYWALCTSVERAVDPHGEFGALSELAKRFPGSYAETISRSWQALFSGRFGEVRRRAEAALELSPRALGPLRLQAFAAQGERDLPTARFWIDRLLQICPYDLVGLQALRLLEVQAGATHAITEIDAKISYVDPMWQDRQTIRDATNYAHRDGPQKTIKKLLPFLDHPNNQIVSMAASRLFEYYIGSGDLQRADEVLARGKDRSPLQPGRLALLRFRQGRLEEAKSRCDDGLKKRPNEWNLLCLRYEIAHAESSPNAVDYGRSLLSASKVKEVSFAILAGALARTGQYFHAAEVMDEAMRRFSANEATRRNALEAMAQDGRFLKTLVLAKRCGWSRHNRGLVFQALKRKLFNLPRRSLPPRL